MLAWDAVSTDCQGGPETAIIYRVQAARIVIIGTLIGDDGLPYPVYSVTAWGEVDRTADTRSAYDPSAPPPGEVALIDIETTDAAGNMSEACL